jgi:hypothetical protein
MERVACTYLKCLLLPGPVCEDCIPWLGIQEASQKARLRT